MTQELGLGLVCPLWENGVGKTRGLVKEEQEQPGPSPASCPARSQPSVLRPPPWGGMGKAGLSLYSCYDASSGLG